jgi:hypothetical protein
LLLHGDIRSVEEPAHRLQRSRNVFPDARGTLNLPGKFMSIEV